MSDGTNHRGVSRRPELPAVPTVQDSDLMIGSSLVRQRGEIEDLLEALPDRPELERLYQRNVPLQQILRLLGHQVDPRQIQHLAECEDPAAEIQRLLDAV